MNGMKFWKSSRFWLGIALAALIFLAGCEDDESSSSSSSGGTATGDEMVYSLDGGAVKTYAERTSSSSPFGYNPMIFAQLDITNNTPLLQIGMYSGSSKAFILGYPGLTAGTIVMAGGAGATYFDGTDIYMNDFTPFSTSTSITVTPYGAVGALTEGTFTATLCDWISVLTELIGTPDECDTNGTLVVFTSGTFTATREPDLGSALIPLGIDLDDLPDSLRVSTDFSGINYHYVDGLSGGSNYTIDLTALDEDADLIFYGTDSTFTTPATCDAGTTGVAGITDESCQFAATGSVAYFAVDYAGAGTETAYEIAVVTGP